MTSVKVAVRVRPLNQRENDLQCKFIIQMEDNKTTITNLKISESAADGDQGRELIRYRQFTYDFSFWSVLKTDRRYSSQQQVFDSLGRDVVTSAYDGYNACVFAYGQTGSGKSYTMMGNPDDPGLIPRICRELFDKMVDEDTSYRAEVSYLEIYNEKVRDLIKKSSPNKPLHSLRVREHPKLGPYVQDLSKHLVNDYSDIENLMNRGNAIRTTAATNMNDTSSRSHAIFTITFTQAKFNEDMPCETSSKIHLVDLAGSERADASGATGQRLKEGGSINKSLVTLGSVISVLADMSEKGNKGGKSFIPYRDSVLTWLLKDSLGGNSRTIMVATISPADVNYGETLSTLRYANRAKNIINRPTVNEDPNVKLIRELREEISRLKTLLGGNIDNISSPKVQEKLHENEARIKVLTQEWAGKWNETENILQNQPVALRKEGLGVVLDSALPHLIGIDDDILSTGIMLYHLKEGITTVGRTDSEDTTDIVIAGIDVEENHCQIENDGGEVTLYPEEGALCAVNGTVVTEPTKLTQGAVILLGKTNMFRFNHPAEAAKMKEELKSCGLYLSRTSLLSQSMSDLYKSSENLALMAAGFEAEQAHHEDLEKLDDKRHQIDLMEKRHHKAEKERNMLQVSIETDLEEKQQQLDRLQKQIDEEISISEKLKLLEERERRVTELANSQTNRLENESVRIKSEYESQNSEVQSLTKQQKELEKKIADTEADITSQVSMLLMGKSQAEEKIELETENLEKLETMLETKRRQVISSSSEIRDKLAELDNTEQDYITQCEKEESEMKSAWNPALLDIKDKNQKIEEAWHDIHEHEKRLELKKKKSSTLSEEEKERLENEKHELDMARTLLKEEEERVSRQQQEVLDNIEKEMDEWEKRKRGKLKEIEKQKSDVVILSDEELVDLQKQIVDKMALIEGTKLGVQHRDEELLQLDKKLTNVTSSVSKELDEVTVKKEGVMREMSREEEVSQALTEISNQIIQVDRDYQTELSNIQTEKNRLLKLKESTENSCLLGKKGEKLSEDERLERKMKEVEKLKQELENAQQILEEKQRKFDEERNAELDKIEYEMLKLQEMERQERINALVEQEVKRRMFEEKLQREGRRKQEREREQSERAEEIQKIKEQHNRELRQLKAKLEKMNNGGPAKSLMPSKSNPYVTVMTPDTPTSEEDLSQRRRTGSSPISGSLILSGDPQGLNILIPSYRRQGYGSDTHYEYEVKVTIGEDFWTIFRRYSRFRQLHQEWKNKIPEVNSLVFPSRKLFSRSEKVVIERQSKLQTYLQNFISVCVRTPSCDLHPSRNKYITKQVLCTFDSFFKRGLFEASKHSAA